MFVLATILILALLVAVHELGHFLAARLQSIHVNRFSIGFGPIVWKYQGAETEYAIRGFPLGGFVGFPDDDPDSEIPPNDPDLLRNRPVLDRAIVISAGVIANLVFAYLVLVLQLGIFGIPQINYQPGVQIPQVLPSSAAETAGLQAGDVILEVAGQSLPASPDAIQTVVRTIQSNPDQPLTFKIQRDDRQLEITAKPEASNGQGRLGVELFPNGQPSFSYQPGVKIREVIPDSVADRAGLQKDDVILSVDQQSLDASENALPTLQKLIRQNPGHPVQLTIARAQGVETLTVRPTRNAQDQGVIGLKLSHNRKVQYRRPESVGEILGRSADQFQNIVTQTVSGFGRLITNFQNTIGQVASPVGIVDKGAEFAQQDSANLFFFAALISINLAVINILPLPALDGGQLAFLLIESVRGKPVPSRIQDGVMQTGLVLLLGLGIFLIIRDTTQLEGVQKLLQR